MIALTNAWDVAMIAVILLGLVLLIHGWPGSGDE